MMSTNGRTGSRGKASGINPAFFPYQPGAKDPAKQAAMRAARLLDRCLIGRNLFGRCVAGSSSNQRVASSPLLDCRLTGESIGKAGYETNVNRVFFQYQPPRALAEIDAELAEVEKRILGLLREVTE